MNFGLVRRHRYGIASAFVAVAAVIALVAYAFATPGYAAHHAELNDGGVWVTRGDTGQFGRLNKPINQLDGYVYTLQPNAARNTAYDVDVLQDGAAVLAVDSGHGEAFPVDGSTMLAVAGAKVALPGQARLSMAGGVLAEVDPAQGALRAVQVDPNQGLSSIAALDQSAKPLALAGAGAAVAVSQDGTIFAASATRGLTTITRAGAAFGKPKLTALPPLSGTVQVTAVGDQPVVLATQNGSQQATIMLPGGRESSLAADATAQLQQPGPASAAVLVATAAGLVSVPLDGGSPHTLFSGGTGRPPAAPVRLRGCVFAAWPGKPGATASSCQDGTQLSGHPLLPASTNLVFRENRGQILLNDRLTGDTWNVDAGNPTQVANWEQITAPRQQQTRDNRLQNDRDRSGRPQPPKAMDDTLGARPGRETSLYVLDNDSDPSGEIMSIDSVTADNPAQQSWLSIAPDGQTVQIQLPAGTTGDTSFKYVVRTPGGGTSNTAHVVVHARPLGVNADPTQRNAPQHPWYVPAGGTVTIPVLADWRDYTDGDTVSLSGASVPDGSGSVAATPDGQLIYGAPATPGDRTISYTASDGMGGSGKGSILVHVQAANAQPVAATAEPDVATGQVNSPIVVHPVANDLPGSDPLQPTATMQLAGTVPSPAGTVVTTDNAAGTVTVVATRTGVFDLSYQVAYGNAPFGKGTIQVTVLPARSDTKPITALDTAVLHGMAPVTVDVLANDVDPNGDLLAVQRAVPQQTSQVQAAVIDGRFVRLAALVPTLTGTQIVTYTVTDGVSGPVTGQITVTQLPMPSIDTPIPIADYATVRAGGAVAIPVLDNDTSPSGDVLTLVTDVTGAPAAGQLPVTPAGSGTAYVSGRLVRYVAPAGVTKPTQVQIDYTVQNSQGQAATGHAYVTITPPASKTNPDRPPAPQPVEARVVAGGTVLIKIPSSGVDPDGDPMSVTGIASATHLGRVIAINATSISYQAYPAVGNGGTDNLGYVVTDPYGMSGSSTIRIAVVPPGDPQPPVAVDDTVTAAPGATVQVDPLANDIYSPGDNIALKLDGDLSGAAKLKSPRGPLVIRASSDLKNAPKVTVVYTLGDGLAASKATVTVISRPGANMPPIAVDQFAQPKPGTNTVTVNLLKGDYDPDGATAPTVVSPKVGVTDGRLTVALGPTPKVIPYVIRDARDGTAMALAYVPANTAGAPRLKNGASVAVPAGGTRSFDINAYVLDPAGKKVRTTTSDTVSASPTYGLTVDPPKDADHLTLRARKGYQGPAAVTFQVTDGATLNQPGARTSYITIPVQVGAVTPVMRCPAAPFDVVEGGKGVSLPIADICHVWMPDPAQVAGLRYSATWKAQPASVSLGGNGTAAITVAAGGGSRPGTTGTLAVTVDGTSATAGQLAVRVIAAPKATVTPIVLTNIKAGDTKTFDLAGYVASPLRDPVIAVVGAPGHASGDPAQISASGSKVTISPGKDSHGTITFSAVLTDVADTHRADRQVPARITVHVLGHPDAPTNVAPGLTVHSHVVDLSWTAPADNGAPIDHYTVNYGSGRQVCEASPCSITPLHNGTAYRFTVTAHNAVGDGPASAPSAPATPDTAPPAVTGFVASGPQDGSLHLAWNRDVPDGSPLTGYQISWPGAAAPVHVAASATSYTATGLDNSQVTTFTIIAFNHGGQYASPPSTTTGQSAGKPAIPAAPTLTVTNDTATNSRVVVLNWPAVAPNGAGPTSYTVYRASGGTEMTLPCSSSTATTCTDSDIKLDGTVYQYSLTARNAAAAGDAVNHTSARGPAATMEAAATPDPITNFSASPTGNDGQATISFNAPASHGKANVVSCTLNGAGTCGTWTFPTSGQSNVTETINGLSNGANSQIVLQDCNGSSGNNFSGTSCVSSNAANVVSYGPIGTVSVSAGANGQTINWSVSVNPNGRAVTVHIYDDRGALNTTPTTGVGQWSDGGTITVGYSVSDTIHAVATDTGSPARAQQSGQASTSTPSPPPPPPSVTASRGNPTTQTGCGSPCYYLDSSVSNFTPGTYTYRCLATVNGQIVQFTGGSFTVKVPANGNVGPYCWGQSGYQMPYYVEINGVMSNPTSW